MNSKEEELNINNFRFTLKGLLYGHALMSQNQTEEQVREQTEILFNELKKSIIELWGFGVRTGFCYEKSKDIDIALKTVLQGSKRRFVHGIPLLEDLGILEQGQRKEKGIIGKIGSD